MSVRRIAALGVAAAVMIAAKEALASLPNIELVSLLTLVYTRVFKRGTLWILAVFVLIEGVLYGFGIWWISYLYIWPLLWLAATLLGEMTSPLAWGCVSGLFGLAFGALTAIPWLAISGASGALAYIANGLIFDLIHCAGNFAAALLLYRPLVKGALLALKAANIER